MTEKEPKGHPFVALAAGGFIGGVIAGVTNVGIFGFVSTTLAASYVALIATQHLKWKEWQHSTITVLVISTSIPLPCGLVGLFVGKALWATL